MVTGFFRKCLIFGFILGTGIISMPGLTLGETMYVKSSKAKVFEESSSRSKVLQLLDEKKAVKVVAKTKRHYKVELSEGKWGWVNKFELTLKPPRSKKTGLFDELNLDPPEKVTVLESTSGSSIRARQPKPGEEGKDSKEDSNPIKSSLSFEALTMDPDGEALPPPSAPALDAVIKKNNDSKK